MRDGFCTPTAGTARRGQTETGSCLLRRVPAQLVRSMTGFGRARETVGGREISVEIRSVNHRYFEVSCRLPRSCSFAEEAIRARVRSRVSRGKVEISLGIADVGISDVKLELDMPLAKAYAAALTRIGEELGLESKADASLIARMPEVLSARRQTADEDSLQKDILSVLDRAVDAFIAMREAEGKRLRDDILSRLEFIERKVAEVERCSADRLERYRDRLLARMREVLSDKDIDEGRILLEAAVYADRSAVDEETVRLVSHIGQFRDILAQSEPVGRRLDFLTQELNREINTIGSKAGELEITAAVVDVKAEIEKIREQIQNIE